MRDLLKILAAGGLLTLYVLAVPALVEGPAAPRHPRAGAVAEAPGPFLPAGAPRAAVPVAGPA